MAETVKVVRVATELLAQLREWSVPVQVRVTADNDGELLMEFRNAEERSPLTLLPHGSEGK